MQIGGSVLVQGDTSIIILGKRHYIQKLPWPEKEK
jgi:hypothetical protein